MRDSHRRKNILTGEWVQVSPHRTKRPWQGKTESVNQKLVNAHESSCYLCAGNKRANGVLNPDYTDVFVFDNDFGALQEAIESCELNVDDLLIAKSEKGICRVICFSPKHHLSLANMSLNDIVKVVKVWKDEYNHLGSLEFVNHVQIFENKGEIMGCSNPHPHGQIWAQESIPQEVVKEQTQQLNYYEKMRTNLLLDYLNLELQKKERLVYQNDFFAIVVPFWAVWPFETMIIPKVNIPSLSFFTADQIESFADAIKVITSKYDLLFDCSFPYSSGIHQAPTNKGNHDEWTLHMHFYPPLLRSATVKKFMVGYEMMANAQRDFTPEYAASMLRELS